VWAKSADSEAPAGLGTGVVAEAALTLLAHELDAPEERPDAAEHGDGDGEPQRDDP
jgi:hypothetical protein